MTQPEHLAGEAFKEARDKIAFLQNQLTETQKSQYAAFVKAQEKEKKELELKAARAKAAYDEANKKRPAAVRNYDPPIKVRNTYLWQMAENAKAEHQKVETLTRTQLDDRLGFLEKLEKQRIALTKEAEQQKAEQQQEKQSQFRDNAQRMTRSRASPEFNRAATPEQQQEKQQTGQVEAKDERTSEDRAAAARERMEEAERKRTRDQNRRRKRERD